jgi:hypothetical protein
VKSIYIFPIISIINIFCGLGLLIGIFSAPEELISPYFQGEITDELIFFAQGIVNVTAVHQIGIGLFIFVLWKLKLDKDSNKKVFLAYSVFGGTILLVALFNHLFQGGGPPIPILVLIISATLLGLYGSKRETN